MDKNRIIAIGLFSFFMLFSLIPTSQAELLEFIVELDIEKDVIYPGDTVVVTGKIVDHAYETTRGIKVLIRTGSDTTKAFTNPQGVFRGEFKDFQGIPGTYTVNVIATWYGMMGLSSTQFQVKGDMTPVSTLQGKLSTEEARKYLSSKESDFKKNPIGQTLFKYYHNLHDELIKEKKKSMKSIAEQIFLEKQKIIAKDLRNQSITKFDSSDGTFDKDRQEYYISGLNPEIRDLVRSQLDFTRNNFLEAQIIRDNILADGGTYAEARKAFLDRISISKETLEQFNEKYADKSSKENQDIEE